MHRIQSAPVAENGWMAALSSIAAATRSENAFLVYGGPERAAVFGAGATGHLHKFKSAVIEGGLPRWLSAAVHRDPQSTTFAPCDLAEPFAMGKICGAVLPLEQAYHRAAYLVVGRKLGYPDYDGEDVSTLQVFAASLQTSISLAEQLLLTRAAVAGISETLVRPNAGIILVDRNARIVFTNEIADRLLSAGDGVASSGRILTASDAHTEKELGTCIRLCTRPNEVSAPKDVEIRRPDREPLRATVATIPRQACHGPAQFGVGQPLAIVMIDNLPKRQEATNSHLCQLLRLTRAEASVALEIARGDGREACAARLGVSVATVRTHLTRIFEKTGVHRQAELVHLILGHLSRPL
ncbi:helix-turn-helix transcriptional regulator [Rhizobium sullae]|uniref:helix-turn-helix transcriptional regulator n=1 Tax=Rhizobium sullae TaxID=50338 RepID=UPI0015C5C835|nr:helix-turn-helix transcriptional regulator [Rhizobium sullae]